MTREMIINELNKKGYDAAAQDCVKNGVTFKGILMKTGTNVSPVIYTETLISEARKEGKGLDDLVEDIIRIYEENKEFDFDTSSVYDRDHLINSLYVGLQKELGDSMPSSYRDGLHDSESDGTAKADKGTAASRDKSIITAPSGLDGIECYMYIRGEKSDGITYNIRISGQLLNIAGISVDEAWERARANTFAETRIENMSGFMKNRMGYDFPEGMEDALPFFILTNDKGFRGAAAILDKGALSKLCDEKGADKVLVMPSSIHEMIVMPISEDVDINFFSNMVKEVNTSVVSPEERLSDQAYILDPAS